MLIDSHNHVYYQGVGPDGLVAEMDALGIDVSWLLTWYLPPAEDVLFLVGQKFGTTRSPAGTWAANTIVPARVAGHYAQARIVALSTGNVYPLVPVASGGATEDLPLTPLGEYANAAVARERVQYANPLAPGR